MHLLGTVQGGIRPFDQLCRWPFLRTAQRDTGGAGDMGAVRQNRAAEVLTDGLAFPQSVFPG